MKLPGKPFRFLAKRPLFVMAVWMVVSIVLEHLHTGSGFATALAFGLLTVWLIHWRSAAIGTVLVVLALANFHWREAMQRDGETWIAAQDPQETEARLLEDARGRNRKWSAIATIHRRGAADLKVRWIGSGEPPPAGTELKAHGVFKPFEPERNPGVPDRVELMRAKGICGYFHASEMRAEQWTGNLTKMKASFKNAFHDSIIAGLDPNSTAAKVILAVVIGEKSPDSLGLIRAFFESGTLHVFSVSGLHVTMVGAILWGFLSLMHCPRRWAIPFIIAAMFGYVWLTGNGPAALRAAWMSSVFLGAFMLRRRPDLLNSLGAVLLFTLLHDPKMISLPGVQLSYGVLAAIGLGAAATRRCFSWIAEEEALIPKSELSWMQAKWLRFRENLSKSLAVSLAASIGSSPLSMMHFGIITPISVFATVFLVFQVFLLLAIALISSLLHPVWPDGSEFLNRKNAIVADGCVWTADTLAKVPGAWMNINSPDEDTFILYDLDYGADAACFASADGNALLIDTGGKYNLQGTVGMSLNRLGMRPDSAIFTHADAGHVAPPQLIREMFPIKQVVLGMTPTKNSVATEWEDEALDISLIQAHQGDILDLGNGAIAEILLSPHDHLVGSVADDRCLVMMIRWQGWKLLWLGDAGRLSEEALLKSGIDLKADLIIAGLHQSDYSLTKSFTDAVSPQAIIVPRLSGSKMDAARAEQIEHLRKAYIRIIDRQQTGGLTITVEAGKLVIRGFLDGSEFEMKRR